MIKDESVRSSINTSVKSGKIKSTPDKGKNFEENVSSILCLKLPLCPKSCDFIRKNNYFYSKLILKVSSEKFGFEKIPPLHEIKFRKNINDENKKTLVLDSKNYKIILEEDKSLKIFKNEYTNPLFSLSEENCIFPYMEYYFSLSKDNSYIKLSVYQKCKIILKFLIIFF